MRYLDFSKASSVKSEEMRKQEKNRRTGAESSMAQKPGTRTLRQGWRKAHQLAVLTSSRTWTPMG